MDQVCFIFKDGQTLIEKNLMYCSNVFIKDYMKHEKISLPSKCVSDYQDFFIFLKRGDVPPDITQQANVYKLLIEWKCIFSLMESFQFRISDRKFPICLNKKIYDVSFSRFLAYSSVIRNHYLNNPDMCPEFVMKIDEEPFLEFLDLVNGVKCVHEIVNNVDVFKICEFFGCHSLCNFFDIREILLRDFISGNDDPYFEKYMGDNIQYFLNKQEFVYVPLPALIRLFAQNKEPFSISDLRIFLENYFKHNPTCFHILFSNISLKFHSEEEINELGQICSKYLDIIRIITVNFQQQKTKIIQEYNDIIEKTANSDQYKEIRRLESNQKQIIQEKSNLETRLQQAIQEKSSLELKHQHALEEKFGLESNLQQNIREKSSLESNLQQANLEKSILESNLQQVIQQLTNVETKLQQVNQEKSILESDNKQVIQQKTNVETKLQQINREKSILESNLQQANREKHILESEKNKVIQEKTNIESNLQQVIDEKSGLENVLKLAKCEIESIQSQNEQLNRQIDRIHGENTQKNQELQKSKEEISNIMKEYNDYKNRNEKKGVLNPYEEVRSHLNANSRQSKLFGYIDKISDINEKDSNILVFFMD